MAGAFALAESLDEATGRFVGLALPQEDSFGQIRDATLLVSPVLAEEQRRVSANGMPH